MATPPPSADSVVRRLAAAGCVDPAGEAGEMLATACDSATLDTWVARREQGEPLAWIIGTTRFCGQAVVALPGVYVPRPQTEELAERAARLLPAGGRAADLCTGTGAVAAHLQSVVTGARVVAVDLDRRATVCARLNGVRAVVGDLGQPLRHRAFDVVTAVAPYVPTGDLRLLPADVTRYEPHLALDGGDDGLRIVRQVVSTAAHLLRRGGWLLTEIGGAQDEALRPTLVGSGFGTTEYWYDTDGDLRGVTAQLAYQSSPQAATPESSSGP